MATLFRVGSRKSCWRREPRNWGLAHLFWRDFKRGCPTLRFLKGGWVTMHLTKRTKPWVEVRGTHPAKTAQGGAASAGLTDRTVDRRVGQPANGGINAQGQFVDHVSSGCSTSPISCFQTQTQTLSVAGYPVRTNTLTGSSTGIAYTSDGPTQ